MRTQSSAPNKAQREKKIYLLTSAMHRLETALTTDPDSPDYMRNIEHRLAHILGKLDGVWHGDRQTVIDKTRKCIETNSPDEATASHLLRKLASSQAA
jgi:hypothetical protein